MIVICNRGMICCHPPPPPPPPSLPLCFKLPAIRAEPSLAGQPLLTQKARKGLVNGVTPACLNGMHITSSNVMSLTINYAYWDLRLCSIIMRLNTAWPSPTLAYAFVKDDTRSRWRQTDSFCVVFRVDNFMSLPYIVRAILSLHYLVNVHVISCRVT